MMHGRSGAPTCRACTHGPDGRGTWPPPCACCPSVLPTPPQVLQRGVSCGVEAVVAFTTDWDSKGEALVRLAREQAGTVYAVVGVHTDGIKRNNDKLTQVRACACVWLFVEGMEGGGQGNGKTGVWPLAACQGSADWLEQGRVRGRAREGAGLAPAALLCYAAGPWLRWRCGPHGIHPGRLLHMRTCTYVCTCGDRDRNPNTARNAWVLCGPHELERRPLLGLTLNRGGDVGRGCGRVRACMCVCKQARLDGLRDAALRPEVVGIMAGLDHSRDMAMR